jgi:hypothetical protein
MSEPVLVCPFNEKLLAKFQQKALVIETDNFRIIPYINQEVNRNNILHAIKIKSPIPLSKIPFQDVWKDIPIVVYARKFGDYKEILPKLHLIRSLNIRIFLSSDISSNFLYLRLLSSLRIACGLFFDGHPIDWDAVNDLMHYAVYSRTNHAPIEPFHHIVSNYRSTELQEYNSIYFDNSARFIHVNENEQIALTSGEAENEQFIATGLDSLPQIIADRRNGNEIEGWQEILLERNECSFCKAFRICFMKSVQNSVPRDGCKHFFSDLMDAADFYQLQGIKNGNKLWQL